jgi:hypothetical protein
MPASDQIDHLVATASDQIDHLVTTTASYQIDHLAMSASNEIVQAKFLVVAALGGGEEDGLTEIWFAATSTQLKGYRHETFQHNSLRRQSCLYTIVQCGIFPYLILAKQPGSHQKNLRIYVTCLLYVHYARNIDRNTVYAFPKPYSALSCQANIKERAATTSKM